MKTRFLVTGARFIYVTVMLVLLLLGSSQANAQADQWENTLPGTAGGGLAVSRQNPRTAYHSGYNGIWKTTDGGATWTLASNGIPTPYESRFALTSS